MPILNRSYVRQSLVGPRGLGLGDCAHKIPGGFKGLDDVYGVLMVGDTRNRGELLEQFSIKWDVPEAASTSTLWIYMGIMLANCDTFGSITVWKGSPVLGNTWAMASGLYDETFLLDITPAMIVPPGRQIIGDVYKNDRQHWVLDTYDTLKKKPLRLIKRLQQEGHWVYVALEMTDGGGNGALYPKGEGMRFYDIRINDKPADLQWEPRYKKDCIQVESKPDEIFVRWDHKINQP